MKRLVFFLFITTGYLYPADYSVILKRNLFAPMKDKTEQTLQKKESLPIIKLPAADELFELKGTFFSQKNPSESLAIIENKKSKEMDFYHIGDRLENATIIDIKDNVVYLEYGFEEIELSPKGSQPVRIYPDSQYTVNLEEFMEEFGREVSNTFTIKATPITDNSSISGFILTGIPEKSILNKYGIKNNDIITKINTIPLDSAEKPFYAYENIIKYGIKRVAVHLLRNNLPYILLYNLN